jgi:hypothetical protein
MLAIFNNNLQKRDITLFGKSSAASGPGFDVVDDYILPYIGSGRSGLFAQSFSVSVSVSFFFSFSFFGFSVSVSVSSASVSVSVGFC